jgi:glutathione S-transferase
MFALELGIPHAFRPVLDLSTLDAREYAGNPALKIPVLVDEHGPLFGTENICRALVRRAGSPPGAILRGALHDRVVANAEELVLHALSTEVTLVVTRLAGTGEPTPKLQPSLERSLDYLDAHVEAVQAALPGERLVSFVEVALFCLVRHLPFRQVLDVTPWARLTAFADRFGARASAQATEYRFDAA